MSAFARGTAIWLTAALVLTPAWAPAWAKSWRIDGARSVLAFEYTEDGASGLGRFERFSGGGAFDPAAPEKTTLSIEIDVRSIRLSDGFRTGFVRSEGWFDVDRHPRARYRLISLAPLGADQWRAEGELTIKGITRAITTEMTLRLDGDQASALGAVRFDRLDFRLGDSLNLFVDIGREISVRFDLIGVAE